MRAVWKYKIPVNDVFALQMPIGAKVIHVAEQNNVPYFWALVDTNAAVIQRCFRFAGTGHPITEPIDKLKHVGSLLMHNRALVFHLFEVCQ